MRLHAATPLGDIVEKEWDAQLFNSRDGLATTLGWTLRYHTLRSKGSRSGFPDRVLVRERILYVELKTEKTKPTADQVEWLDGLANAGGEVYLWRPSDLEEAARVLSSRGEPAQRCGSRWVAGVGRTDSAKGQAA